MGKTLIILGIVLVVIGLMLTYFKGIPLGRLPGDIKIEKENFTFYLPIMTSIIISLLITLIFFLAGKK